MPSLAHLRSVTSFLGAQSPNVALAQSRSFIHFILISKHIASVLEAFREVAFVSVVFRLWVLLPGAGVCAFSGSAAHGATPSKRGE